MSGRRLAWRSGGYGLPVAGVAASPRRVAVVRVLPGLGDGLCAVPALRAMRRAWPDAEITIIGRRGGEWLEERFPAYIDAWMPCDVWPGLAEIDGPAAAAEGFLAEARARRFDLAVQMHGSGGISNGLTAALGARRWVGLVADPVEEGAPADGRLGPYPSHQHEVERCLAVARLAGASDDDPMLEFPVSAHDAATAAGWVGPDERFAVVHPGAGVPDRRWDAAGFAAVTDHLLRRLDPPIDRVVITGGSGERELTATVIRAAHAAARSRLLDLAGATTLGPLAALLRQAVVLVANDTGVVHLAAAVGTPTVVVGGGSDWPRWRPRGQAHRTVGGPAAGGWPEPGAVIAAVDEANLRTRREVTAVSDRCR